MVTPAITRLSSQYRGLCFSKMDIRDQISENRNPCVSRAFYGLQHLSLLPVICSLISDIRLRLRQCVKGQLCPS